MKISWTRAWEEEKKRERKKKKRKRKKEEKQTEKEETSQVLDRDPNIDDKIQNAA